MSKMPAKKKSCFQITSVTQAQVAATGAADDTESLEDPDEARAGDGSSEIFDLSRSEYEPAGGRSSSNEDLNDVREPEAPSHTPQAGQVSGTLMGEFLKVGVPGSAPGGQQPGLGSARPGTVQQQQPAPAAGVSVNASQPAPSSATPPNTSTVSCTSRFRVIKLDHGTGEPFRRGRWTCTEFYEKDSEGSAGTRTADGGRHGGATALDPAADRDSGIGLTGGSVMTHSGQGSVADASLPSSRMHSVEMSPQQPQTLHQNYSPRQPGVSGSAPHSAFSGSKPVGGLQPSAPQSGLPAGQNGLPQSVVHVQKSPIMPPSAQPAAYPQQHPMGHHLSSQSSGLLQNHTEYYQQQQPTSMQPGLSTGQSLPVSSLSAGPQPVGQGHPSASSVPSQVGDVAGSGGVSVPTGQPAPGLLQQQTGAMGAVGGSILVGGSPLSQYTAAGQPQPHGLHPTSSSVQNVPATAVSSSVPSASSEAMPNVTTSSWPPGQIPHSRTLVALGMQGLPTTVFGHVEGGGGGKSEGLVNAHSPVVSGKEAMKPFMPESLQLATPTVNSLFGIHIPIDGDLDRNPSKAFYQAFQSGSRLRDSKAHSDRASGTNVAAIDNKIEQAMDLVKSHLMYAVREEVEVLKEQIKELFERNSVLERENAVLKSLANSEQLSQLPAQPATSSGSTPPQQGLSQPQPQLQPLLQLQAQPQLQAQLQAQPQLQAQLQAQPQLQAQLQAQPPLQLQPLLQLQPQPQHHPNPQQLQTQPQLDPSQQQMQPNVTSA